MLDAVFGNVENRDGKNPIPTIFSIFFFITSPFPRPCLAGLALVRGGDDWATTSNDHSVDGVPAWVCMRLVGYIVALRLRNPKETL